MIITSLGRIPELLLIEPDVHHDERGYFRELYHETRYLSVIPSRFVQDNHSFSKKGVLRGLHCQFRHPQGKLVTVLSGEIFDVAVDVRSGSPTFGQYEGVVLSSDNHRQLYVPEGFVHGFCVIGESAFVIYKCTEYFYPNDELGVRWDDPALNIPWPDRNPIVSSKDMALPTLNMLREEDLPKYKEKG
jgi:dTDP-4-dehydrorhamnose 3,5-epimerase